MDLESMANDLLPDFSEARLIPQTELRDLQKKAGLPVS